MTVQPLDKLRTPPAMQGIVTEDWTDVDVAEIEAMLADLEALTQQLPEDDGRPMETRRHHSQMDLLIRSLEHAWRDRQDYCVGGNQFVYYSTAQAQAVIREVSAEMGEGEAPPPGTRAYRGPDFFVVRGIDGSYLRQKWVTWMEGGRYPDLIIELLSPSTRAKDLQEKKQLYEQTFRTAEYFVWDPFDPRAFEGWRLVEGRYEPIEPDEQGRRWSQVLEMWVGPWQGTFDQDRAVWLRFYDVEGQLVLTGEEAAQAEAEAERKRAEAAQAEAAAERKRAEAAEAELARLRAHLAELEGGA
ncbi:MAG: Uma2 family endonuclease [Anaerolineae bacterium]